MAVSRRHEELVLGILQWATAKHGPAASSSFRADCVLCPTLPKPLPIGNYLPDFYADLGASIIIGEAKTIADIETLHTQSQIRNAVQYFQKMSALKSARVGELVIATPWPVINAAKRLIRTINRRVGFEAYDAHFLPQ